MRCSTDNSAASPVPSQFGSCSSTPCRSFPSSCSSRATVHQCPSWKQTHSMQRQWPFAQQLQQPHQHMCCKHLQRQSRRETGRRVRSYLNGHYCCNRAIWYCWMHVRIAAVDDATFQAWPRRACDAVHGLVAAAGTAAAAAAAAAHAAAQQHYAQCPT
jgi:transposase-like protein